ncbi:MAG: hypothetical protein SGI96_11595, partial [Bacteroidota bacterium]|nr:hypothetical protein [Bacteroidota bacterium]
MKSLAACVTNTNCNPVTTTITATRKTNPELIKAIVKLLMGVFVFLIMSEGGKAQISITSVPYAPGATNFDLYNPVDAPTLASTIPTGWTAASSGTATHNGQGTGTSATGGYWGYGTGGDFSLGALRSVTPGNITYSVSYTNNTGSTINTLTFSWDYEQWRYVNTSGWNCSGTGALAGNVIVDGKDFAGVAAGTNGTVTETPVTSFTLTGLSIANGATFGISWVTTDITGSDNGISIDNFNISACFSPVATITGASNTLICAGQGGSLNINITSGAAPFSGVFDIALVSGAGSASTYSFSAAAGASAVAVPTANLTNTSTANTVYSISWLSLTGDNGCSGIVGTTLTGSVNITVEPVAN